MDRKLELIIAIGQNNVIGFKGGMPWRAPLDMKRFVSLTSGHALVMGRTTYQTGLGSKPLPKRDHFILSRDTGWRSAGERVFECYGIDHLAKRLADYPEDKKIFLAGGAEIYSLLMPFVSKIHVSWIHGEHKGDTHFDLFKEVGGLDRVKLINQEINLEHIYQEFDVI